MKTRYARKMRLQELRERVANALLMVLEERDSVSLDGVTRANLIKIGVWAQTMMYEASDNPVRARHAPKVLRERLPADHYLQRWRMPKRRKAVSG